MLDRFLLRYKQSRVGQNISWIVGGRLIQMLIAFVVNILTARYLGPSNFGLINYAAVYTGFFTSICSLGLNSIIVKELLDNKERQGESLGTVIALKAIASFFSCIAIWALSSIIDKNKPETTIVVLLCSIGLFFQAFSIFEFWFQSRLESKTSSIATIIAYIFMSLYKVILLVKGMSVEWFAMATSVDYFTISVILYFLYKKNGGSPLHFSFTAAKRMLSQSYHFILSSLMVSIYGNTDKFMLKNMLNSEEMVAYYSTAVSLCTTWVFVLQAIIDSFYPTIMESYKSDYSTYKKRNEQLYSLIFYISISVSTVISLIAAPAVKFLYGEAYEAAISPLRVITWYTAFSYLGVARNAWLVCEGKQKYLKYIYGSAIILNVLLNWALIPYYTATGAAIASLVTQIATTIVLPLFIKPIRDNSIMMLRAISFRK